MFSTVNDTGDGTSFPMTYSTNNLLQLSVKRLLQNVSTHQVSVFVMTIPYIAFKHKMTYYHYISLTPTHTKSGSYCTINSFYFI